MKIKYRFYKLRGYVYDKLYFFNYGRVERFVWWLSDEIGICAFDKLYKKYKSYISNRRFAIIIFNECCSFNQKYDNNIDNIIEIRSEWHHLFDLILYYFGFNKKARYEMWRSLYAEKRYGEENATVNELFDNFSYYLSYCSDRWCLDRIMRTHWKFQEWYEAAGGNFYDDIYPALYSS